MYNSEVFGGADIVDTDLDADLASYTVFDCVLLDNGQISNNNNNFNNNNNINVSLLLICKAIPDMKHCFEFIKITLTFSNGYQSLLSCWYQRDNNVSINSNLNLKKIFDSKNECLFGWCNKTIRFKTECIKIKNDQAADGYYRLLIIVINTSSHHIILYNCDLNNYIILKLNSMRNITSNKIFPHVCSFFCMSMSVYCCPYTCIFY